MTLSPITKPLDLSNPRYWQQNAKMAVRDIFDAITELVTNADDAYERAKVSGRIETEIERRRKGVASILRVRDFATGLTHQEMDQKLSRLGERRDSGLTDGESVRGTNSRGAKDVAALGPVTFESISRDGRYSHCHISSKGKFSLWPDEPATLAIRTQIGIPQGSGTLVTIEVDPASYPIPQHGNLRTKLEQLVFLREILADPQRQVYLRDSTQERSDQLRSRTPEGTERVKETIKIPGYPGASAKLVIKRARCPLENHGKFRVGGILIMSRRAVHEATLFAPEFEHDPHAALFFGRLRCEFIDDLWNEYDDRKEKDLPADRKNPGPVLDPFRQVGLIRAHPFVQALQQEVLKRLRPLVEEERRREESQRAQIENRETRRRLNELEKLATRFMQKHQEESDDLDNPLETDLPKGTPDASLNPPFAQMILGETRRFVLTVNQSKHPELAIGSMIQIQCETPEISTNKVCCPLEAHPSIDGQLRAVWDVSAVHVTKATGIVVRAGSVVKSTAIEVLASERDLYADVHEMQFRRKRYGLRPDHPKQLRLLAPYPGVVASSVVVAFTCDRPEIRISGGRVLYPREKLGIAECKITAVCAQPDLKAVVTAQIEGHQATTELVCGPPEGDAIKIELMDVDYRNQRYLWEKGTNKLIIAARHPSIRRYLGPANAGFSGQDKTQFKVLLAEIVAFAVSEKVLERRVAQDPDTYRDADLIAYLAERDELVTEFLPLAHESQVPKPL